MELTRFEKELLVTTIMQSIEALQANPSRRATPMLDDAFGAAIDARRNLLTKVQKIRVTE